MLRWGKRGKQGTAGMEGGVGMGIGISLILDALVVLRLRRVVFGSLENKQANQTLNAGSGLGACELSPSLNHQQIISDQEAGTTRDINA